MVKTASSGTLYVCEACGFKYRKKTMAKKCEAWCRARGSCNTELAKQAVK